MTRSELKAEIKNQFGTMARFARISGIDCGDLWDVVSGRVTSVATFQSIVTCFESFKHANNDELISDATRKKIELQVFTHFKTRSGLVRAHEAFTDPFVSNLINGQIKYYSPRVNKLVEMLNALDVSQKNS